MEAVSISLLKHLERFLSVLPWKIKLKTVRKWTSLVRSLAAGFLHQEHYHIDRHFSYPIHMADRGFQIGDHKMALKMKGFQNQAFYATD